MGWSWDWRLRVKETDQGVDGDERESVGSASRTPVFPAAAGGLPETAEEKGKTRRAA